MAAKEKGFTLVKIGAPKGEKVMTAIDNLAAQKAQGFVICTPDVKLGPGIVAKAKADGLKMMTVDDRLVDGAGKPIARCRTWASRHTTSASKSVTGWLRKSRSAAGK